MSKMRIPKHSYAFIDGSFNEVTKVYGCGGFLIDQKGVKHIIQASGKDPDWIPLRNVAGELLGARKAIELASKLKMKKLHIYHDYEGISNWPMGIWKAKSPATKEYVQFVWEMVSTGLVLYFTHVQGHAGIAGNVEADRLAREAVGLIKKAVKEAA